MAASRHVDLRRVVERVEDGEEAFARHGENAVAAIDAKLVDEDLAAGARSHVSPLAASGRRVTSVAAWEEKASFR